MPLSRISPLLLVALLAGSCGGGSSAPPPPPNRPPSFTSPATTSVPENTTAAYSAAATDADGDAVIFSISGGADQARFQISMAGALTFATPPDFEAPTDADRNNVYLVQLTASDGRSSTTLDLQVTVTNVVDGTFRVRRVGTGFAQPLYLVGIPDRSGRVFVVEQAGRIRILNPATGQIATTPFLDIATTISSGGERGLLGLALAPDFATSGVFYVNVTNLSGDTEIRRYRTVAGNPDQASAASGDVILAYAQPFANHNGGWIDFGPDGFLYIGSGDGGSSGDPQDNGQNVNTLLGKMLRIDVRTDAFPNDPLRDYAIPPTNPFAAGRGAPEILAIGLRNPYRASFDSATGNLFIGDVGQNAVEEIDLVPRGSEGLNFGWSRLEGTLTFNGTPPAGAVPPIAEYRHDTNPNLGNSVTGGYVYRGPVETLAGEYFFADFITGKIWTVPVSRVTQGSTLGVAEFTQRNATLIPDAGAIGSVSSFGLDQPGNLYIVDYDGDIFVIEAG